MPNRTRLPPLDGKPFLAKLEEAQAEGDADHVERNMPRLEQMIGLYQDRAYEIAQLQYRARLVRDRHEPSAEKRSRGGQRGK